MSQWKMNELLKGWMNDEWINDEWIYERMNKLMKGLMNDGWIKENRNEWWISIKEWINDEYQWITKSMNHWPINQWINESMNQRINE